MEKFHKFFSLQCALLKNKAILPLKEAKRKNFIINVVAIVARSLGGACSVFNTLFFLSLSLESEYSLFSQNSTLQI